MNLYTLGYQGIGLDAYIERLRAVRIGVVVDVRETAWSHKRSFCKTLLREQLNSAGIEYIHVPSAGNPKQNRRTARSQQECLLRFGRHLRSNPTLLLDLVVVLRTVTERGLSACLTCYEKLPEDCHRSVLISALRPHFNEVKAVHL